MNAIVDGQLELSLLDDPKTPPEVTSMRDYQHWVDWTCTPKVNDLGLVYAALGLAGETGEVVEKIKKIIRDGREPTEEERLYLKLELGDVVWYVTRLANLIDIPFMNIVYSNVEKLNDRRVNGKRS